MAGITTFEDGTILSIISSNPADVVASRDAFLTHPAVSLTLHSLAGIVPAIAELAALPELARVTSLKLAGQSPNWQDLALPVEALRTLVSAPALSGVKKLVLEKNVLDDLGARALGAAPWLASVEELCIMDNPRFHGDGFAALAPHLTAVRSMYITGSTIGTVGARALSAAMTELRDLHLDGCGVGADGASALFDSQVFAKLERLRIVRDSLGDALARLGRRAAPALRELELPQCGVSSQSAVKLAVGCVHRALSYVDLSDNRLADDAAIAVAASRSLPALEKLDLRSNAITETGAAALGANEALTALTSLGLTGNELKTGATREHTWEGGMWEAGSVVVEEKLTATQIEERFVKRGSLHVF